MQAQLCSSLGMDLQRDLADTLERNAHFVVLTPLGSYILLIETTNGLAASAGKT